MRDKKIRLPVGLSVIADWLTSIRGIAVERKQSCLRRSADWNTITAITSAGFFWSVHFSVFHPFFADFAPWFDCSPGRPALLILHFVLAANEFIVRNDHSVPLRSCEHMKLAALNVADVRYSFSYLSPSSGVILINDVFHFFLFSFCIPSERPRLFRVRGCQTHISAARNERSDSFYIFYKRCVNIFRVLHR